MATRSEVWSEKFNVGPDNAGEFGAMLGEALTKGFQLGLMIDKKELLDPDKSGAILGELVVAQLEWFTEEVEE